MEDAFPSWEHIKHASLSDVIGRTKTAFFVWLVFMIFSSVFVVGFDFVVELVKVPIASKGFHMPNWLTPIFLFILFLWYLRENGLAAAKALQKLSKRQFFVIIMVAIIGFLSFYFLHWFIAIGISWAIMVAGPTLYDLDRDGKMAMEKMRSNK